jgi:hypothetical protein
MRRNDFLSVTVSGGLRGACLKVAERRRKPQPAGTALERHEVGPFASRVFQCRPSEAKGRRSWYRRNSKGTRREFEFYLLKDWAFRGQASSRTRPVASPTRRLIQRGETSTCRRQPRQERSAPSTPQHLAPTKRDKSASPRTSLATICCPRAGPKRPTKTPGAQALGANSPRSSARRCAYTDINALRPWRVRPKTRRPLDAKGPRSSVRLCSRVYR